MPRLNVISGQVITDMTARHRAKEFRKFLDLIDKTVPRWPGDPCCAGQAVDPQTPSIQRWLLAHPCFTFHFIPTYSSWMNLFARGLAELTTKWLRRGTHLSGRHLIASIRAWITTWNDNPKLFVSHKTADEILDNLATYPTDSEPKRSRCRSRI